VTAYLDVEVYCFGPIFQKIVEMADGQHASGLLALEQKVIVINMLHTLQECLNNLIDAFVDHDRSLLAGFGFTHIKSVPRLQVPDISNTDA
jgi:hypothetical protein